MLITRINTNPDEYSRMIVLAVAKPPAGRLEVTVRINWRSPFRGQLSQVKCQP